MGTNSLAAADGNSPESY